LITGYFLYYLINVKIISLPILESHLQPVKISYP
jgi:hypothetical protein